MEARPKGEYVPYSLGFMAARPFCKFLYLQSIACVGMYIPYVGQWSYGIRFLNLGASDDFLCAITVVYLGVGDMGSVCLTNVSVKEVVCPLVLYFFLLS